MTVLEGSFCLKEAGYFLQGNFSGTDFSIKMEIPSPELAMDMLLAMGVCGVFGTDLFKASEAIGDYKGGSGRMQPLRSKNGILYLLDHYNANPLSMEAAFSLLENYHRGEWSAGKIWGILGEMLELGEDTESWHRYVGQKAARLSWGAIWFKGNYFESFLEGFVSSGGDPSLLHRITGKMIRRIVIALLLRETLFFSRLREVPPWRQSFSTLDWSCNAVSSSLFSS